MGYLLGVLSDCYQHKAAIRNDTPGQVDAIAVRGHCKPNNNSRPEAVAHLASLNSTFMSANTCSQEIEARKAVIKDRTQEI